MSIHESTRYVGQRDIELSMRESGNITNLITSAVRRAPYILLPSTEATWSLQPMPINDDLEFDYGSKLEHGTMQTARLSIASADKSTQTVLTTSPEINGLWQTPPKNPSYTTDQVVNHLQEMLPDTVASDRIFDKVNPTAENIQQMLIRMPKYLGGAARHLVEYTSYHADHVYDNGLPARSLTLGRSTTVRGDEVTRIVEFARHEAVILIGKESAKFTQLAISEDGVTSSLGIKLVGNSAGVPHYAEAELNELATANMIEQLEKITHELSSESPLL